ncbi:MAG: metal ABC transporter permease [Oscillospiraceae bacterium]|jgi:manganese/zinc/iron transport system permease protein|nr:metal ABC transporter permease [Oscillospiraceae bacterium]
MEIILIYIIAACASSVPGNILVFKKMSMESDAVTHTVLPGIAVGFIITGDIYSPWLYIAAVVGSLLAALISEKLRFSKYVKEDSAIGLVFPIFFAVGIILVKAFCGGSELNVDYILKGDVYAAVAQRMVVFGYDIGSQAVYLLGGILAANLLFVVIFRRGLISAAVSEDFAKVTGIKTGLYNFATLVLTAVTAVAVFNFMGSVLSVALMIAPAVTARCVCKNAYSGVIAALLIAAADAVLGCVFAMLTGVYISGAVAVACTVVFLLILALQHLTKFVLRGIVKGVL